MEEDDDLRQADLSHLSIKEMNARQRAEMRRRLEYFVRAFSGTSVPEAPEAKQRVRKWVPGMKR